MNQKLIDRIIEVSEWSTAGGVGDTGLGMIAFARELRDMIESAPADSPEPVAGKQHIQRDVLVINATVAINSALALLIGAGYDVSDAIAGVRRMLDEYDAGRGMLDAEPEPAYSQREVLVIQTAVQFAAIDDSTDDFNLCIASARRLLDAFDASREKKP